MSASEVKPDIKGKLELMHLVERLKTQKRTGWVREGIRGPESIADHMYRMSILSLLSEEDEDLDIGKCVQMAVVHDLAEASVGDITPFDGVSKEEKQKLEADAMHNMTANLLNARLPASKRIHSLWHEYEEGKTKEAKFVKDLDRIEMALQGFEYEKAQNSNKIQPFFESSVPKIQHPEVRKWAHELMEERRTFYKDSPAYKHVSTANAVTPGPSKLAAPVSPSPLVQLSPTSVPVTDADEEIFDIYTRLSASTSKPCAKPTKTGLGFVDSKAGLLEISLEVPKPSTSSQSIRKPTRRRSSSSTSNAKSGKTQIRATETIEISIQQDLTRLHGRDGDTGSVVWRASLELAELILAQRITPLSALVEPTIAKTSSVIELGSGTGILSVLLSPLFGSWTATDLESLTPLITKNIKRNSVRTSLANLRVDELDWTWSAKQLSRMWRAEDLKSDLALAVDCLFNESLVRPFVDTLNHLESKIVIVVSELRSSEVLRLFLQEWLASGAWQVWRACKPGSPEHEEGGGDNEAAPLLASNFVVWVGWRG